LVGSFTTRYTVNQIDQAVIVDLASRPRSLRTRSPVLMPTGQRWAQRPVAAQVSTPW